MSEDNKELPYHTSSQDPSRRDFIVMGSTAVVCAGAAAAAVPFISSWAPDKGVLAIGSTEINLTPIKPGETHTFMWRGGPVFVRNRTPEEIKEAQEVNAAALRDPQTDAERVKPGYEQWLIVVGVCTHLGCVPLSKKEGWLCPCHGSYYDTSGRIVKGPAPLNLPVPPYEFINATTVKIG